MPIDYSATDRVVELSFGKLDKTPIRLDFPAQGSLSQCLNGLISKVGAAQPALTHQQSRLFASAGVEMWHRAIHSFLLSVALTESSHLWASISGYYASHFVMRAFAHSMGIFKSFTLGKVVQVVVQNRQFVCLLPDASGGEHAFYWKAVKGHAKLTSNPLFRENSERNPKSDSAHRTFANYTDHLDNFSPMKFPELEVVATNVAKISQIRLHSVTEPSRDDYPDLENVQILAFQRIVAFHDFLEERVSGNRFWRAHRRPAWCRDVMLFQVENQGLEQPISA
jgi:hypothetical protein